MKTRVILAHLEHYSFAWERQKHMKIFAKHPIAAGFTACRWTFVRFFIIAVLLTAATFKAWQLATVSVLGEGLLHSRLLNVLVVEFEIFFSFWLITGLLPKLTWLASIVLFSAFTIVSLLKAVTGETSCGCFGNVTVNPWITALFDLCVVGLLGMSRPKEKILYQVSSRPLLLYSG
ncbi:MAG: hypothetical protein LBU65_10275, partial [Planctomycetaceae bacterium]|nr:hypothetical protein [Planctomycetaceae bacterium]